MIAALFVQSRGVYFDLPDVEPWDLKRDAMKYNGPWPVVAHPPCARWCQLAGLVEARWGHRRGDDGGMFAHALRCVRWFGGVLEHPAYSRAFIAHGIAAPTPGGWQRTICGGWVAHVEQGHYGHQARKATWLYAWGVHFLPSLAWAITPDSNAASLISWCGNRVRSDESRPRLSKKAASKTPEPFRDLLISMARSVVAP